MSERLRLVGRALEISCSRRDTGSHEHARAAVPTPTRRAQVLLVAWKKWATFGSITIPLPWPDSFSVCVSYRLPLLEIVAVGASYPTTVPSQPHDLADRGRYSGEAIRPVFGRGSLSGQHAMAKVVVQGQASVLTAGPPHRHASAPRGRARRHL